MSWDWNPGFMKCIFPLSFQLRITKQSRREQEETETGLQDNISPQQAVTLHSIGQPLRHFRISY